jgi:hypothetical protein
MAPKPPSITQGHAILIREAVEKVAGTTYKTKDSIRNNRDFTQDQKKLLLEAYSWASDYLHHNLKGHEDNKETQWVARNFYTSLFWITPTASPTPYILQLHVSTGGTALANSPRGTLDRAKLRLLGDLSIFLSQITLFEDCL